MVDSAFLEWDKAVMSNRLLQHVIPAKNASSRAALAVSIDTLNANFALLLVLALIIIPTLSGVALIN
jgi:hypothetical protein